MIELKKLFSVQGIYTAIEPIWGERFEYKKDRHNFWELVYVSDGCAGILKDDTVYELLPGEMIFHKPMEFHSIWAKNSQKLHLIVINFSAVGTALAPLNEGVYKPNEGQVELLHRVLDCACHCAEFEDDLKNHLLSNYLELLLATLLDKSDRTASAKKRVGNRNYEAIIKAMNETLNRRMTIEELAKTCKLSPSNLKKIFRKYSGMGVIEYFNQLKVSEALRLLDEDVAISEISDRLGFSSQTYFCDSFKKHCGITPSEYRKKFQSTASYKKSKTL